MKTYVIAGLLLAGMMTPALAAEYYVTQSTNSHKCSIVTQKPDDKSMTLLGSGGYASKAEAKQAMKGMSGCKA